VTILIFAVLKTMTQQSILHLVVNWEVFTINNCSFYRATLC